MRFFLSFFFFSLDSVPWPSSSLRSACHFCLSINSIMMRDILRAYMTVGLILL